MTLKILETMTFRSAFPKECTLFVKGIAILLLLWHHFFGPPFENEVPEIIYDTARYAKLCLGLFTMVSGYGIAATFRRNASPRALVLRRVTKLLIGFWCVAVPSIAISWMFFHVSPWSVFSDHPIARLLLQLLGLQMIVANGGGYNGAWWYMSTILFLYMLAPTLLFLVRKSPIPTLVCAFLLVLNPNKPDQSGFISLWILPFVTGMVLHEKQIFERLIAMFEKQPNRTKWGIRLLGLGLCVFATYERHHFPAILPLRNTAFDTFTALPILGMTAITFPIVPPLIRNSLVFLGRHSMNMYLVHQFFKNIWMQQFFNDIRPYIFFSFPCFVCVPLGASILVEGIKLRLRRKP